MRLEVLARERRMVKDHASNSIVGNSDRSGCSAVAGESLHSNAGIYQVNFERRRGYRRSSVATEYFRPVSFPFPDSRWHVRDDVRKNSQPR